MHQRLISIPCLQKGRDTKWLVGLETSFHYLPMVLKSFCLPVTRWFEWEGFSCSRGTTKHPTQKPRYFHMISKLKNQWQKRHFLKEKKWQERQLLALSKAAVSPSQIIMIFANQTYACWKMINMYINCWFANQTYCGSLKTYFNFLGGIAIKKMISTYFNHEAWSSDFSLISFGSPYHKLSPRTMYHQTSQVPVPSSYGHMPIKYLNNHCKTCLEQTFGQGSWNNSIPIMWLVQEADHHCHHFKASKCFNPPIRSWWQLG